MQFSAGTFLFDHNVVPSNPFSNNYGQLQRHTRHRSATLDTAVSH